MGPPVRCGGYAHKHKHKLLTLVDRNTGLSKSMVVDDLIPATLLPILQENTAKEAVFSTDEARQYVKVSMVAATFIPTRLKAISASSSEVLPIPWTVSGAF
ncbi:MAG: ISXO2-like transposase domain [Rhodobacteraceae bacterium HLUCCA12]|nr:MAG: ISXO2-like transposase domain [Rhodobacteraceae bacterium HLUCCA12]